MKVVISQVNVGSKFRFMPSGVSSSLSNYPRDGWLTEAAARKWAKANGHEIVKVEKVAGNGEKIHRIEYTYKDRFGKTKKQTSELVGKDVEPLKKRIVEGLTRNGDTLVSFGKITTKDSVDSDLIEKIKEKYHADSWNRIDRESKRKIISHLKTRWKFPDHIVNRFIRDFERDLEDLVKEESWEQTVRWIDGRAKKVDINPYSKSYGHSLTVPSYERKQPGVDKLRKPQTNNPKKYRKDSADFDDEPSMLSRVAEKYAMDAIFPTSKGFANEKGLLKRDTRKGLKPYEVTFVVKGKDGRPFNTKRSKMAASIEDAKKWAQSESKKYNGVTKIDVKEFKDSCEDIENIREKYANDAAFGVKVKGNEKATERLTMEKVFKELSPAPAWKKVKKGNTIVIRTNINGKDQDVVTIKYFNPNIVAMTPKGGAANMVALKDVSVMCNKLGVEGRRSYNDSADDFASDASVATFTVKSNRNGSKYGYIEKICKTEAEAKALVDKLKKDGFVAMYRKVMYRDSSDTMDRIRAKYCMDGPGYNFYDLKTALANGDIKPNQRMVSSVGGGMAKTAKEWLDMGVKVVNANKPYALNKIKTR